MYTHSDPDDKKSIHYMDPITKVSRRECLAFAKVINQPRIIKDFYNDWVSELGDQEDRTNMEALATWVSAQSDILITKNKKKRVQRLRSRFKQTMYNWMTAYQDMGFEKFS